MIAIIAEKPSLARNIVDGIGQMTKKNGYYENSEYIVTYAFGHLFSLCDVEDYLGGESKRKWSLDILPCYPEKFKFKLKTQSDGKVDEGVRKQFKVISDIVNRTDVNTIVNAGDSDREGEIIIRLCIENSLKTPKNLRRLWLPDQTPQTVGKALAEMRDEKHYDDLANEGFSRTYVDWLYGVNLTRFASVKSGTLLRVGRVIVPIVKAVYDRDREIENFKPEIYYSLVSNAATDGETIELVSKYKFNKDEKLKAERCCERMNLLDAFVTEKKSKKETQSAGKLYSLTKLQNFLGKKYKMSMETSLAVAQKLYERGFISYPRTNSEYLATNEKEKFKTIVANVKKIGYDVVFKDKKNIFDDSKIEAHSALTPTYKIPSKNDLSEDESIVYSAIMRRFAAIFCAEDCIVEKSELTISLGGKEDYSIKGSIILQQGWMKYDGGERKDKILPRLKKGDKVNVDFHPVEKQTSPPKHYTIETLNNYLKNPFKDEKSSDDNDEEEYKAIFKGLELGTEATRTGIIDNAKKSNYISLKKDVYRIEPGGKFLIEQLSDMHISMDKYKTSQLGQALKKVYRGELTVAQCVQIAKDEISEVFKADELDGNGAYGDVIGKCPKCGKDLVRGRFAYQCDDKENCGFKINLNILGHALTKKEISRILETGESEKMSFTSIKNGKKFEAKLKLSPEYKLDFKF